MEELKNVIEKEEEIERSENGLEITGRFRMGNKAKANEYWKEKQKLSIRLCAKREKQWSTYLKIAR